VKRREKKREVMEVMQNITNPSIKQSNRKHKIINNEKTNTKQKHKVNNK
jgi:hypothetical protein